MIQEFWVNVYPGMGYGAYWPTREMAADIALSSVCQPLYRIHVKLR